MNYKIEDIEGIGPAYAGKLESVNITTTGEFLELCSSAKGRKNVCDQTGVGEHLLLKWANLADMMRIKGVATQFAELLEAAGVDTVKELRTRRADNLTAKMSEINKAKRLCRTVPPLETVQKWIDQASEMTPLITHG